MMILNTEPDDTVWINLGELNTQARENGLVVHGIVTIAHCFRNLLQVSQGTTGINAARRVACDLSGTGKRRHFYSCRYRASNIGFTDFLLVSHS